MLRGAWSRADPADGDGGGIALKIGPKDETALVGRDEEIGLLCAALDRAGEGRGGAVLIEGDPGIGKTALVDVVRRDADARGHLVLECGGARDANSAGFSGLHQMLQPLLGGVRDLPHRQAVAIRRAFGLADDGEVDRLLLGLGALGLLEDASTRRGIVILVEDLHWVDASTTEVVGFLAKRLGGAAVLLIATAREDVENASSRLFDNRIHLEPLGERDADALIARAAPLSPDRVRQVIRATSLGNPLALTEFAAAAAKDAELPHPSQRLTVTTRLEQTFLSEISGLPDATRRALLVAAAAQGATLDEVIAALERLGMSSRDFVPAERLHVLSVRSGDYRFRHPLISSALYDAADSGSRSDAHLALAASISDPIRAAWHRASAASGRDEHVAAELEAAAMIAERRGAQSEAAAAWRRSAQLSPLLQDRARRTVLAAESSRQAGAPQDAAALVAEAMPIAHDDEDLLRLARTDWMLSQTTIIQGRSATDLVELAATFHDASARIEVLVFAAVRAYIVGETREVRRAVVDALRSADPSGSDLFQRIGLTLMEPGHGMGDVSEALGAFRGRLRPTDAVLLNCLAFSAEEGGDLAAAETVWNSATLAFHDASHTSDEATGLCGRGGLRVIAGRVTLGLADAEQALQLSSDLGLGVVGGMAAAYIARARALRGEREPALAALEAVSALAGPAPFARIAATAAWAAAQLAMNEGRFADALDEIVKTDVSAPISLWAGGDLAEIAVRSGRRDEADAWLQRATRSVAETSSDHLRVLVERSRGLLEEGPEARRSFEDAIDAGMRVGATLEVAKTRLFFGERLRRERRIVEARSQLWEATRAFESESIRPLAERAAAELRAAGGVGPGRIERSPDASRILTGQELQVARLAADGLTNKQIADQIYVSHRTVGAHLHRAFSKLGVSRRSQLSGVFWGASGTAR